MALRMHPTTDEIAAYVDGELTSAQAAVVRRHCGSCSACARQAAEQQRMAAMLRNASSSVCAPVAPVASVRILDELHAQSQPSGHEKYLGFRFLPSNARLLLVLLGTFLLLYGTQSVLTDLAAKASVGTDSEVASYVEGHINLVDYYETMSAY